MNFDKLPLPSTLIKNLEANNFIECTEVQTQALPQILSGKSLMVQAHTGTGKTAAFLIPLIARLMEQSSTGLTGLVIGPTRELASQIMEDAEVLGCEIFNINRAIISGGSSIERQRKQLKEARFIVATPGRLLDFCNRDKQLLSNIDYFVLDESDRLFDMGFYPDIKKIIRFLPSAEKRLSLLFSATLDKNVRNLANRDFHKAMEIDISKSDLAIDKITQEKVFVLDKEKIKLLLGLLTRFKGNQSVVVFTNTKHSAETVALKLIYNDINCDYISGDLPQNKRQRVIQNFKTGKVSVLVATDVAARGLHVNNLDLVVNFDLPDDPESYIHRIGRTGRAGLDGEAVTFVCDKFAYNLESIEKLLGHKIPPMEEHYADILAEDKSEGIPIRELAKSAKIILRSHRGTSHQKAGKGETNNRKFSKSSGKSQHNRKKDFTHNRQGNNQKNHQKRKYATTEQSANTDENTNHTVSEYQNKFDNKKRRDDGREKNHRKSSQYNKNRQRSNSSTHSNKQHSNKQSSNHKNKKTLENITETAMQKVNATHTLEQQKQEDKKNKKGLLSVLKIFKKDQKSENISADNFVHTKNNHSKSSHNKSSNHNTTKNNLPKNSSRTQQGKTKTHTSSHKKRHSQKDD